MAAGPARDDDQPVEAEEDRSTAANLSNGPQIVDCRVPNFNYLNYAAFHPLQPFFLPRNTSFVQLERLGYNEGDGEGGDKTADEGRSDNVLVQHDVANAGACGDRVSIYLKGY